VVYGDTIVSGRILHGLSNPIALLTNPSMQPSTPPVTVGCRTPDAPPRSHRQGRNFFTPIRRSLAGEYFGLDPDQISPGPTTLLDPLIANNQFASDGLKDLTARIDRISESMDNVKTAVNSYWESDLHRDAYIRFEMERMHRLACPLPGAVRDVEARLNLDPNHPVPDPGFFAAPVNVFIQVPSGDVDVTNVVNHP